VQLHTAERLRSSFLLAPTTSSSASPCTGSSTPATLAFPPAPRHGLHRLQSPAVQLASHACGRAPVPRGSPRRWLNACPTAAPQPWPICSTTAASYSGVPPLQHPPPRAKRQQAVQSPPAMSSPSALRVWLQRQLFSILPNDRRLRRHLSRRRQRPHSAFPSPRSSVGRCVYLAVRSPVAPPWTWSSLRPTPTKERQIGAFASSELVQGDAVFFPVSNR
jgi:hypothetical protein